MARVDQTYGGTCSMGTIIMCQWGLGELSTGGVLMGWARHSGQGLVRVTSLAAGFGVARPGEGTSRPRRPPAFVTHVSRLGFRNVCLGVLETSTRTCLSANRETKRVSATLDDPQRIQSAHKSCILHLSKV